METLFLLAVTTESALFIGLLIFLVLVGVGGVLWSRKRGAQQARDDLTEELGDPISAGEALPERSEPEDDHKPLELLPVGKSIQDGLAKTRQQGFVARLAGLFRKELDDDLEQQIEEVLLTSDIGVKTAGKLLAALKTRLSRSELKDADAVWTFVRDEVKDLLGREEHHLAQEMDRKPWVIAVIGVNGTGKTTTIGKLAARFGQQGKKVLMVAADTYRAAAVDQLEIWSRRAGAAFHRGKDGQDPASVAFDGIKQGVDDGVDIVLVDTAGRLHTQKNLVEELKKIIRVCDKACPGAPQETLLVLDATTGQNAIQQANIFAGAVDVHGIVLTKLDGTTKGGVVIGISQNLGIPISFICTGEGLEDFEIFRPREFVEAIFA